MGKNKKMKREAGGSQHSSATVFVSNLPYTFSNSQLEETFSDVGPVRRCFMVTQKGSTEHRGFAFVQFAVTEDAKRAIELKNGSSIGGRTIGVKHAMHRAPLEQRRSKGNEVILSDNTIKATHDSDDIANDIIKTKDDKGDLSTPLEKHKPALDTQEKGKNGKLKKASTLLKTEIVDGDSLEPIVKHKQADSQEKEKNAKPEKAVVRLKTERVEGISSEKQRVARTVVIGGLLNDDMAEDVHSQARECGSVSLITYPLPKEEITHHGLLQDGCRLGASSIIYTSVRSARACVAKLHQKNLSGGTVWARQLGGEGSKVQKWKLIIRNLPFKADVNEIKEMFSAAGYVWDVFIPKKTDSGLSKGFAFVKFTCKQDAENAIQKLNGKSFGKRPIAVDWAVPKKIYTAGSQVAVKDGQEESDKEDSDSDFEDYHVEMDKSTHDSNVSDDSYVVNEEVNFDEEADVARKVLNNFLLSNDNVASAKQGDETMDLSNKTTESLTKTEMFTKSKMTDFKMVETEEELERTLFISNLPFDITNEEVKQRFIGFGEIQSFVPVLHPVTKRPRGTGFLKFKTSDAADASFEAATAVAGLGIILKGRKLKVLRALNKKAAHDMEAAKIKKEEIDHRNLYLAKEGFIPEGTPAAEGVSESDMAKRRSLEQKKETKLKSPNFHVSRTRLIMYNVPKSMNEKQLKKLCLDAVTSRATKQKPMIRQIKLLQDSIKGKEVSKNHSRGVAFIEFTEHQHALVALRVLNNNPETFTTEHRPIVEFALDNIQTMRQRNDKIEAQQKGFSNSAENTENQTDSHKSIDRSNDSSRKRKSQENKTDKMAETETETKPAKKKLTGSNKPLEAQQEIKDLKARFTARLAPRPMGVADAPSKKRSRDQKQLQTDDMGSVKRRKNKQNKDPLGQDTADKLDMLIEQYRSKFSGNRTNKSEGESQGSRRLGRWFQS